jgi:subtilisin family serine protease
MIEDDASIVPWEGLWDQTLEQLIKDGTIGFTGDLANPRGDWVLFRPGRLLVDARVTKVPAVEAALRAARAQPASTLETERARAVAARLDLRVYETGGETDDVRLVDTVREINRAVARSASLDHVLFGGPARWGGDSVPVAIPDPGTVPGPDSALGKGMTVAVLDTGIADVPFPADAGAGDAEVPDEDRDGKRDAPAGHGTHVAGLVTSVAAGARIVARRILTGVAGIASDLDVAGALLDNAQADIINCSFSGPVLDDAGPPAVLRALAQLPATTVVVACAGNLGSDRPQWPAAAKGVIAVGAIQRRRGSRRFDRPDFTNFGEWVDCCAPGVDVPSTFLAGVENFGGFATWTGTSMACPQVAGAIAAIASRDGIDATTAAQRLVHDPSRPRMPGLGAIVDPANLP